jgi:hypothetical protein
MDVALLDLAAYLSILTTCMSPQFVHLLGSLFPDTVHQPAALAVSIVVLALVLAAVRPYHVARGIIGATSLGLFLLTLPSTSTAPAVLLALLLYVGLRFIFRSGDWAARFIPEAVAAGTCLKALLSSSDLQRLVLGAGDIGLLLIVLMLIPFRNRGVQRIQRILMALASIYVSSHQMLSQLSSAQATTLLALAAGTIGTLWLLRRRPRRN